MDSKPHAVILFDGVCRFCNASVNFVIRHDKRDYFRFAAQQDEPGLAIMKLAGLESGRLDTLILHEDGKTYTRSTAALRIARKLSGGWWLLYAFVIIPRPLRDFCYNLLAKNRYR